jgi:hypothetical protein
MIHQRLDMNIKRLYEWAADIVVTHRCNRHCAFCCDKYVNKYDDIVKIEDVKRYLDWFKEHDAKIKKIQDIMILGGEPTMVGIPYLQEICDLIHSYESNGHNWKVSLTTNNYSGKQIEQLDGYVDYLNISVYNNQDLLDGKLDYDFKKSELVYAILLSKAAFPTHSSFDDFIDKTREKGCDVKFSTFNKDTPMDLMPEWIDGFMAYHRDDIVRIFETCWGMDYRDCVIKFMHLCDCEAGFPKLYPNGKVNRTWNDEKQDMRPLGEWLNER